MLPSFQNIRASAYPFPHVQVSNILEPEIADKILCWLRTYAPWNLRVESFYEQHEISLLRGELAPEVIGLTSPVFVDAIREELRLQFKIDSDLMLVDIGAHRLTKGQTIRIHNDYLDDQETHRLLIQINGGWSANHGGLLMLFAADTPESLRSIILPTHASGFAFEISRASFHAVSTINEGERYTLVYTFRRALQP